MNLIKELFKNNYKNLLFVYLLFIAESVLVLLYPMVLGNSIDHFISKNYNYTFILVLVLGGFIFTSYFRRVVDTRVFSTMYRKLILKYINGQVDKKTSTSTITARTNMLNSIVSFLEIDLPYIFFAFFSVIGSITIIMIKYNLIIGLVTLASLIPILLISNYFRKKLSQKYSESNDLSEKDVEAINSLDKTKIKHHYLNKNFLSIDISNLDAKNNLFNNFINYTLIVLVLFLYSIIELNPTIGSIMGLYQYVLKFTGGVLMFPNLILRYEYLKDVIKRIND
jgi:ABC-type multidrug transport system fused ATPase/permease subunit